MYNLLYIYNNIYNLLYIYNNIYNYMIYHGSRTTCLKCRSWFRTWVVPSLAVVSTVVSSLEVQMFSRSWHHWHQPPRADGRQGGGLQEPGWSWKVQWTLTTDGDKLPKKMPHRSQKWWKDTWTRWMPTSTPCTWKPTSHQHASVASAVLEMDSDSESSLDSKREAVLGVA